MIPEKRVSFLDSFISWSNRPDPALIAINSSNHLFAEETTIYRYVVINIVNAAGELLNLNLDKVHK